MENFGVCIITLNNEGKVLLGERKNSYKAGFFGMPGGRVEREEPLIDACKREMMEETGLVIDDIRFVGVVREKQEGYTFIHFGFTVEGISQTPQNIEPDKCLGWEWMDIDNLPEKILPGHKGIIDMYRKNSHLVDIFSS